MKTCDAVKTQNHGRDNGRRTGRAAVGLVSRRLEGLWAAPVVLLSTMIFVSSAQAQLLLPPEHCATGRELITIPEVKRDENEKKLKAVLMLSDENRSMWVRKVGGTDPDKGRCLKQRLRYFKGWNAAADPPAAWPPPTSPPNPSDLQPGEPIPGPTLRARIGDLIQISFMNQIDTSKFPTSLDQGDLGKTTLKGSAEGCDQAFGTRSDSSKVAVYPLTNTMPNCLHGSSTANVHFHGTHTTPSTTGDNVLLYIRPALRVQGQIAPTDAFVNKNFDNIFESCEKNGSPTGWSQLPSEWRTHQETLLKVYDKLAPYKGIPGNLPAAMKLWPKNAGAIAKGKWPQYSVGAFPYCFRLPDYATAEPKVEMGQAPGTHWYHAHKHGSTALNVTNGMLGAFIIEGPYDDALRAFYKETNRDPGLEEKVLVIQQLEPSLNMLSMGGRGTGNQAHPATGPTNLSPPPLSVNGRRQPFITMRPGQVQMWRIVNGAPRSFVKFLKFAQPPGATETVDWRQTAQDGVQFAPDTYEKVGKLNAQFTMAAANRVDLLVKAPTMPGSYALEVVESVVTNPDPKAYNQRFDDNAGMTVTLLTVKVAGAAIDPLMTFIPKDRFPTFPEFLKDIPPAKGYRQRTLVFNTSPGRFRNRGGPPGSAWSPPRLPSHFVNGKLFEDKIEQHMLLGSVEEWTVLNGTVGIAHPFHIHINPFQVVEVFDPNSEEATKVDGPCYADPKDPATWKRGSCNALKPPFAWWDVRAIPSARPETFDCDACPSGSGDACSFAGGKCTVEIPGYFKMRSRFVDYPGVFVHHCHILAHEDVGMMQLIEVYTDPPGPTKEMIGYTHY